jgi:hypothetical protein
MVAVAFLTDANTASVFVARPVLHSIGVLAVTELCQPIKDIWTMRTLFGIFFVLVRLYLYEQHPFRS